MSDFEFGDDIIDSRDVAERIVELENEISDKEQDMDYEFEEEGKSEGFFALSDEVDDLKDDLEKLREFENEVGSREWDYGLTLILNEYFETYARELAEDIGAVNSDADWPNRCIDWEQAAEELQMDYSCVEVEGYTYWYMA